jgi:hypothetical protein
VTVALVFTCPTCKLDFDEPYCESCGASLMPKLVAVPDPPSPYRELMIALARTENERKP